MRIPQNNLAYISLVNKYSSHRRARTSSSIFNRVNCTCFVIYRESVDLFGSQRGFPGMLLIRREGICHLGESIRIKGDSLHRVS